VAKLETIVYTCLTNDRTKLEDPTVVTEGVKYICFTDDKKLTSDVWEIRYIENLNHKHPKLLPYEYLDSYNVCVWVDACVSIQCNIYDIINSIEGEWDVATFSARDYQCAYREAQQCLMAKLDDESKIKKTVQFLEGEKYPRNNGLSACTVVVRKNNEEANKLNLMWWNLVKDYSSRDQITFNYCLWKLKTKHGFIPGTIHKNKFLEWRWKR
jgi:hypothetical protein